MPSTIAKKSSVISLAKLDSIEQLLPEIIYNPVAKPDLKSGETSVDLSLVESSNQNKDLNVKVKSVETLPMNKVKSHPVPGSSQGWTSNRANIK